MIKALISDFGGVLMRTRTDGSRRALEQRLGLPPTHDRGAGLLQRAVAQGACAAKSAKMCSGTRWSAISICLATA